MCGHVPQQDFVDKQPISSRANATYRWLVLYSSNQTSGFSSPGNQEIRFKFGYLTSCKQPVASRNVLGRLVPNSHYFGNCFIEINSSSSPFMLQRQLPNFNPSKIWQVQISELEHDTNKAVIFVNSFKSTVNSGNACCHSAPSRI